MQTSPFPQKGFLSEVRIVLESQFTPPRLILLLHRDDIFMLTSISDEGLLHLSWRHRLDLCDLSVPITVYWVSQRLFGFNEPRSALKRHSALIPLAC